MFCSIEGCGNARAKREWCNLHYRRWLRHGDPLGGQTTYRGDLPKYLCEVVLPYMGDECLIWPFSSCGGYPHFVTKGVKQYVHRIACEAENGPPPSPKHEASHSCGNGRGGCVTRRHLSWKTHTENMADKLIHGTHNRGERARHAKLTETDVRTIRSLRGVRPQDEIAGMFGVSRTTISSVHIGKNWGWLEC